MELEIKETELSTVWRMRQKVMYPASSIDEVKLADDEEGLHLGLYGEDELISIISLFRRGEELQFRKFATAVDSQGKGYGSHLLRYVFEQAKSQGVRRIWCNARQTATALYEKFGMRPTGKTWEKYGIGFIKMEISLG